MQAGIDFLSQILVTCKKQGGAIFGRQDVTGQSNGLKQVLDGVGSPVIGTASNQDQVRTETHNTIDLLFGLALIVQSDGIHYTGINRARQSLGTLYRYIVQ